MAVVAVHLGRAALGGPSAIAIAVLALGLLLRGVNAMWLLAAAAVFGLAVTLG